jgi:hypothetical protein
MLAVARVCTYVICAPTSDTSTSCGATSAELCLPEAQSSYRGLSNNICTCSVS